MIQYNMHISIGPKVDGLVITSLSKLLCGENIFILQWHMIHFGFEMYDNDYIILFTWNCLSILLNCDGRRYDTTCYAMVEAPILLVMQ